MTEQEFNLRYSHAVEKCAIGVAIIRHVGPQMGFSEETIDDNRTTLVEMLANGIGLSWDTVVADVLDTEQNLPGWIWRDRKMRGILSQLAGELKVAGLLT